QIDGTTDPDAQNVGDGGSTGEQTLDTGDHTVGETAGTSRSEERRVGKDGSKRENGTGAIDDHDDDDNTSALTVPVAYGDDIGCTITNERETGKVEAVNKRNPTSDAGKSNLQIDGTTDPDAQNVGDGGSTGEQTLDTGDHTVGETAGTS